MTISGTHSAHSNERVKIKTLMLDGTDLTVTAAEINALSATGLSATELGYLDAVVAGTAAASKAVVLNSSKGIATITSATITTLTSTTVNSAALTGTTTATMTSANAAALAVGLNGATNPAFVIDSSTGSQAAGLKVTGAVAAGTVAAVVISSGADASLTINAKGTGTIGIGSVSSGAVTITPATTVTGTLAATNAATVGTTLGVTGVLTPTGGVAAAGGFSLSPRGIWVGQTAPQVSTDFNDSTPSTTETYVSEVHVPANCTITGVALFNGTNVTGNVTVGLADSTGAPIVAAKSASTAGSGTDALQRVPFATPYAAKGPATYFIQVQYDSATARYNTHVIGNHGVLVQITQTYGTLASFTPPTTFVSVVSNVAGLY